MFCHHLVSTAFLLAVVGTTQVHAWVMPSSTFTTTSFARSSSSVNQQKLLIHEARKSHALFMAGGFGGAGGGGGGAKKAKAKKSDSTAKLRAKQQWDRFNSFKGDTKFPVAVREIGTDKWLQVGSIRSEKSQYTEISVAKQRALIAEHAKRLYPLEVTPKVRLEWGYAADEDSEYTVVDHKAIDASDDVVEDVDKKIGFEGTPDPNTGYYCLYNEGRLVSGGDSAAAPLSGRLNELL